MYSKSVWFVKSGRSDLKSQVEDVQRKFVRLLEMNSCLSPMANLPAAAVTLTASLLSRSSLVHVLARRSVGWRVRAREACVVGLRLVLFGKRALEGGGIRGVADVCVATWSRVGNLHIGHGLWRRNGDRVHRARDSVQETASAAGVHDVHDSHSWSPCAGEDNVHSVESGRPGSFEFMLLELECVSEFTGECDSMAAELLAALICKKGIRAWNASAGVIVEGLYGRREVNGLVVDDWVRHGEGSAGEAGGGHKMVDG